jgi:hypothetical protein
VLQGGGGIADTNADLVTLWNPAAGGVGAWDTPIYYQISGTPTALLGHWNRGNVSGDDWAIDRDEAFLVTRRGTSTNLTVAGEVSGNSQSVIAGVSQRLFAGGMAVVDVTLANSGLTNSYGFHAGGGIADTNATLITKWNPEAGSGVGAWDTPIYFQNSGTPTALIGHWNRGNVNADTNILSAGEGWLIKNPGGLHWTRLSPLQ